MRTFEAHRFDGLVQSEIRRMTLECERVGGLNLAQEICDLPVPEPVREAAERALREPTNTYSKASGIPELRRAIAHKLQRDNQIAADPETEIVVTAGVTEERLREVVDDHTRAIVVCTPSNPSGKMYEREELEAIARIAHERDLLVITDEIYEYFTYDGAHHISPGTVGELWPRTVSLMGFSKTFAVTGWRIAYAVAHESLARRILLANDLYFICANRPAQSAVAHGVEVLSPAWYRELARAFQAKRDRLCAALEEAGFAPLVPHGAYYVLADAGALGYTSARSAAMELLERCGVAAVPGTAFYHGSDGERFLRVCFAKEDDVLDDACARIRSFEC